MSFTETILRIEAERMEEARQAIAAGWTEADHPHKCCPHLTQEASTPKPKPDAAKFYATRLRNAEARAARLEAKLATMDAIWSGERVSDHGEINIPLKGRRQRELESAIKRAKEYTQARAQLEYTKSRAAAYADKLKDLAA